MFVGIVDGTNDGPLLLEGADDSMMLGDNEGNVDGLAVGSRVGNYANFGNEVSKENFIMILYYHPIDNVAYRFDPRCRRYSNKYR